jgi:hypothetical protein
MITCNYVPDPPRVTLDVTSMPAGTARVEVVRIDSNGAESPVRGAADVPVQDTAAWTVIDWDVPIGRAPVWRATYRNAAGGLLGTETGSLVRDGVGPELLANGGFDDGLTGWATTGTVQQLFSGPTPPHAVIRGAGSLSQSVVLDPGAGTTVTVSHQNDPGIGSTVTVTPDVGNPVMAVMSDSGNDWVTTTVNLPAGASSAIMTIAGTTGSTRVDNVTARAVYHSDGTVPAPDCDLAWISNPYDPDSAMMVTLMAGTDDETGHDMTTSLSLPGRRTHLPSAVVGVRGIGGSRTLVVRCWSLEEAQQLEDLLATTTTLLVRSPAIRHRTGCLYVVIGEAREMSHHNRPATPEATTWTLSADEVDPGALGILVPPWTYADLWAYLVAQTGKTAPTYTDLQSVFPLYLDVTKGV